MRHIGLANTLPTGMPRSWNVRPMARASSRPFGLRFRWFAQSVGPRDFESFWLMSVAACRNSSATSAAGERASLGSELRGGAGGTTARLSLRCWASAGGKSVNNASATSARNMIDAFSTTRSSLKHRSYGTNTTRPTTLPALRSLSAALASGSLRRVTLIGLSVPF